MKEILVGMMIYAFPAMQPPVVDGAIVEQVQYAPQPRPSERRRIEELQRRQFERPRGPPPDYLREFHRYEGRPRTCVDRFGNEFVCGGNR